MSEFTEQEFNEAMAELANVHVKWGESLGCINIVIAGHWPTGSFTPYDDLNQLMPIAWTHGIDIDQELDGEWSAKAYIDKERPLRGVIDIISADPIEAIRQCLWQVYQESIK